MTRTAWLPFGAPADAETTLLCLPHAGAGASVYRAWGRGLHPRVAVRPLQPPGRERRREEPPYTAAGPLARDLARTITAAVPGRYALFGHSTGAICAFETVRELRRLGAPPPVHLFVSGRRAPRLPMVRHDLAALSVAQLADVLRDLGGTPEDVLAQPGLLATLQPVLAADFALNEGYPYRPEEPLTVPITAFAGEHDPGADPAAMAGWADETAAPFRLHLLDGGHFAVFERAAEVHAAMGAALTGTATAAAERS